MQYLVFLLVALSFSATFAATEEVRRGQYLVNLLGCEGCHTQGRMVGESAGRILAGSDIGIAYSRFVDAENPPVVFPSNLTPDKSTGIGAWDKEDVITALRHGLNAEGQALASVMPWLSYGQLNREDAEAITAYLMSLPPISHAVPEPVASGEQSEAMYVRFGIYIFMPHKVEEAKLEEAVVRSSK